MTPAGTAASSSSFTLTVIVVSLVALSPDRVIEAGFTTTLSSLDAISIVTGLDGVVPSLIV